jgi:nitrate/TMAO reductase-like tetraheme cytochrome c subunit
MNYRKLAMIAGALALCGLPAAARAQAAASPPPAMKHALQGREKCLMCHASAAMKAVPQMPASHKGRDVETCMWCHAQDAAMQTKAAPEIPHALAGRANCMMCHKPGVMEKVPDVPADHAGRANTTCEMCHQVKKAS